MVHFDFRSRPSSNLKFTSEHTERLFWPTFPLGSHPEQISMEYKEVKYSVLQLTEGVGWRWEVKFADGKSKSGVTPISRAAAIKMAEFEIDRVLKDRKEPT